MPASLVFRTDDPARWGGGQGSDLAAVTIDLNFWTLFSAVQALEDHQSVGAGIDYINQPAGGNLFYIHLTDHRVLGPFVIPSSQWNPRGEWEPITTYAAYDVVSHDGALYLIVIPHTSGTTFSAFATDGQGHLLYNLLLAEPANGVPPNGTRGQRLVATAGSPASEWQNDFIRLHVFVEGQPNPAETLLQYTVTDDMTLPINLEGSVFYQRIPSVTNVVYEIAKNGTSIGTIEFDGPSPVDILVTFTTAVTFVPGDILTLIGPTTPDAVQLDISFTLLATLT